MDELKEIVWTVPVKELNKMSDYDFRVRKGIASSFEKMIKEDNVIKLSCEKCYRLYVICRNYILPNHATYIMLHGMSKFGAEFLEKFDNTDLYNWMFRVRKLNELKLKNKKLK